MVLNELRRRRDQASLALLFVLFMLLPLTVVFGHRGVAPWLLLASIPAYLRHDFWLSAFGALFDRLNPREPFFAGFLAISFFCFWIFLSGFWSPREMPSLAFWVLAPVLVGGSAVWFAANVNRLWAWRIAFSYAAAIVLGMGVLTIEGASGAMLRSILPPHDPGPGGSRDIIALGRGVTALAPALFPAGIIAAAVWNRYAALGVVFLGIAAAFSNDVSANAIALLAGLAAAIIAFRTPRSTVRVLSFLAIAALTFAPLAAFLPVEAIFAQFANIAPPSWLHRLAIWQAAGSQIPAGLPFGFGADYARIWHETAPMVTVPGSPVPMSVMPNHPHNLFLQIWLELGLPGVAAFGAFIYFGGRAVRAADLQKPIIAASAGAFAAILVSVLVEGSLWQVWRFAAMGIAAMGVGLAHSIHVNWSRLS